VLDEEALLCRGCRTLAGRQAARGDRPTRRYAPIVSAADRAPS
jgi:hypothetical protein